MKTLTDFKRRCILGATLQSWYIAKDGNISYNGIRDIVAVRSMMVQFNDDSWMEFPPTKWFKILDKDTAQISFEDTGIVLCYRFVN